MIHRPKSLPKKSNTAWLIQISATRQLYFFLLHRFNTAEPQLSHQIGPRSTLIHFAHVAARIDRRGDLHFLFLRLDSLSLSCLVVSIRRGKTIRAKSRVCLVNNAQEVSIRQTMSFGALSTLFFRPVVFEWLMDRPLRRDDCASGSAFAFFPVQWLLGCD